MASALIVLTVAGTARWYSCRMSCSDRHGAFPLSNCTLSLCSDCRKQSRTSSTNTISFYPQFLFCRSEALPVCVLSSCSDRSSRTVSRLYYSLLLFWWPEAEHITLCSLTNMYREILRVEKTAISLITFYIHYELFVKG